MSVAWIDGRTGAIRLPDERNLGWPKPSILAPSLPWKRRSRTCSVKRRHQTGDVNIHKIPGRPSVKGKALREWLPRHLEANPDLTLKEHCEAFEEESGLEVSEATMSRNIARLPGGWPLKRDEGSL
jgi:hypothetical protein